MYKVGLVAVAALGLAGLASGCGGSSKTESFSEPEGGSGGSSSAQAGSTQADAGDGQGPGAGGDGSSTGGTASGGTSMGGTSMGGTGVVPMTDPAVRMGCDDWCASVTDAACNEDTLAECLLGCRAVANSPACNSRYGELFECAKDATFACNDDGDAVPQGCEVEYANTGICLLSNPDETIEAPCQSFCDAAEAAECPNSAPAGECTYGCQLTSSLVAACSEDWKTFVDCASDAEVTCNEEGDAVPAACGPDYLRYVACYLDAGM